MNRNYKPTPHLLRSVFLACAVTITVAVAAFIDMLASDRGTLDTYAARPSSVIAARG